MTSAIRDNANTQIPPARLTITEVAIKRAPVLGKCRIYTFAALGTGIGILSGVAFAGGAWLPLSLIHASAAGPANGRPSAANSPIENRDLGTVNSMVAGLKGHLKTQWDGKLSYQLSVEPSDQADRAEFALTVSEPPRPLSIGIQLVDSSGALLCSREIDLKPGMLRAPSTTTEAGNAGVAQESAGSAQAAGSGLAQATAFIAGLPHGRDVFEKETGADGQIAAVRAQGELLCSKQGFDSVANWNLVPDFPTVAEQADLLKRQAQADATEKVSPSRKPDSVKKVEVHKLTAALVGAGRN
jgi:hypothetical protein